jgi:hypothetical protein
VAALAVDAFGNMRRVIEVHKVGNAIHFHPADGLSAFPCLSDLDHFRFCRSDKLMTSYAAWIAWLKAIG